MLALGIGAAALASLYVLSRHNSSVASGGSSGESGGKATNRPSGVEPFTFPETGWETQEETEAAKDVNNYIRMVASGLKLTRVEREDLYYISKIVKGLDPMSTALRKFAYDAAKGMGANVLLNNLPER